MPVRLPEQPRPRAARSATTVAPAAAAIGLAVALLLSGCSNPAPLQPSTPEPSAAADGAAAAPGANAGPSPSPSPEPPKGTPVRVTCKDLLPTLASFGRGFQAAQLPADTSKDGLRADILTMQGVACAFHSTDGKDVEIDVAAPVADELETRRNAAILQADPIAGYPAGVEAYFEMAGDNADTGVATIYSPKHMIVMRSKAFFEPGDHADLGNAVLKVVGG